VFFILFLVVFLLTSLFRCRGLASLGGRLLLRGRLSVFLFLLIIFLLLIVVALCRLLGRAPLWLGGRGLLLAVGFGRDGVVGHRQQLVVPQTVQEPLEKTMTSTTPD